MPRWQQVYVVACAAVIGYCVLYVACDLGGWPRLTYYQYERAWHFVATPGSPVPSNYVGTVLWGFIGGAAATAISAVGCRLRQSPVSPRWLHLWAGWAVTAFGFGAAYFLWNLWP